MLFLQKLIECQAFLKRFYRQSSETGCEIEEIYMKIFGKCSCTVCINTDLFNNAVRVIYTLENAYISICQKILSLHNTNIYTLTSRHCSKYKTTYLKLVYRLPLHTHIKTSLKFLLFHENKASKNMK